MLKIAGLSLVLICSVGIGFYTSHLQKSVLEQTKNMLDFMYYIKQQIEYFNTPLDDIYSSFDNQNQLFSLLVKDISTNGWKIAVRNQNKLYIPKNFLSIIDNFGNTLGKTGRKDQLEKCDYYIKEFEQEYENLKQTTPQKTKTSIALCFYVGLMIIILFL
jgi:stage III sporulation protein AB